MVVNITGMIIKSFKNKRIKHKNGFGLIETVAALGVTMIVVTSMVSMSLYALRSTQQSQLMLAATKLANEELERVRAKRDTTTWSAFLTAVNGCTQLSPCSMNELNVVGSQNTFTYNNVDFRRSFVASYPIPSDTNVVRIGVTVSWKFGSSTYNKSVYNYTDLSNWR